MTENSFEMQSEMKNCNKVKHNLFYFYFLDECKKMLETTSNLRINLCFIRIGHVWHPFRRSMKPSHAARKYFGPFSAMQFIDHLNSTRWYFWVSILFPSKFTWHNSQTDLVILVDVVKWKWIEESRFVTIFGWRVLRTIVLSSVGMSNVCGRNVSVPKASKIPPKYLRDRFALLFWPIKG